MADEFSNVYEDDARADSYAKLEFPGTYYLAYRDLPQIIDAHVKGGRALDFGCGTGRSTRFLKQHGFEATGVDISEQMLIRAREFDPAGDYRLISEEGPIGLPDASFDLGLSVFTFDNVPMDKKAAIFGQLRRVLKPTGYLVSLVSAPEIYVHEWASFSTKAFPGNRTAKSGDKVLTVMLDVPDQRPVEDVLCLPEDYGQFYREAGLRIVGVHQPLGKQDEPFEWVSETRVAPWTIYVLATALPSVQH